LNDFLELIYMVKKTRSQRGQRGNILIFLTLALPFFVGLVGLGIDATMCYIVQTELSAAVDGAALGAGRLLSTNANPNDIANEFLNANFRVGQSGFWRSYNLTPTVTVVTGMTKTVTVTATVTVPLLFMRLLHHDAATVGATATATRRDARIEFVIDRSGSMNQIASDGNTAIYDVVQKAQNFTEQFTSCPSSSCSSALNYDELGLVVFSGSAVVGYPTTPWPSPLSTSGGGGPDIYFYNGASTDMVHQLGNVTAGDGTAMGDGLALAYIELQKTHVRDMAANGGVDNRMNAIVLFTDGVPSSVVTYPNQTTDPNNVVSSGSGCTYKKDTTGNHPIQGYVVVGGSPPYSGSPLGFYQLASLYPSETSASWMGDPTNDMSISAADSTVDIVPSTGLAGCSKSGWNSVSNLSYIPSFDKYGHSLNALTTGGVAGYNFSLIVGDPNATKINSSGNYDNTKPSQAYQWGLAGWNEVDNVANDIRNDSNYAARGETSPMPITIYTIGYTGNGGTDSGLLTKIANIYGCTVNTYSCVNTTQKQGLYAQASNADEISNAFNTILTAILRLSR
jgi:Flp pilus assembly protein TadG